MLPRRHRLTGSRRFRDVLRGGSRARSGSVVAVVAQTDADLPPRLGLIVGRQVGDSVRRHRVSRILRHAVREPVTAMPTGTVVVLRALPTAASTQERLADDARRAVARAVRRR